jgi:hypothetical protein
VACVAGVWSYWEQEEDGSEEATAKVAGEMWLSIFNPRQLSRREKNVES